MELVLALELIFCDYRHKITIFGGNVSVKSKTTCYALNKILLLLLVSLMGCAAVRPSGNLKKPVSVDSSMPAHLSSTDTSACTSNDCSKISTPTFSKTNTPSLNVDNLLLIIDSSSSLNEVYDSTNQSNNSQSNDAVAGFTKFSLEKKIADRMNNRLPQDSSLIAGLRIFGYGRCLKWKKTRLLQPLEAYSSGSMNEAISRLVCASGGTPAYSALEAVSRDMMDNSGNKAIIFISDGNFTPKPAIAAVRQLKKRFNNQLCVYPVWVGNGNDQAGYQHLQQLTASSCCGFTVKASEIQEDIQLQAWLDTILNDFGSPNDSDCDGVANNIPDQCPNTPLDWPVNSAGCPQDKDRDGVFDYQDHCPATPFTAHVDKLGCWNIKALHFDTDKSTIKPRYYSNLNEIVRVMKNNPTHSVIINGHTDNIASYGYNKSLSKKRARAVENYLVHRGFPARRIKIRGYSYSRPVAVNSSAKGRAINRRAIIEVR